MSRSPKRQAINPTIKPSNLNFPSLISHLYSKSTAFILPILRRFFSKFSGVMDSILFSYSSQQDDDVWTTPFDDSFNSTELFDTGNSIYLVSFRWWKEAVDGGGVAEGLGGVLYSANVQLNSTGVDDGDWGWGFNESEIFVNMRREGEGGITGEEEEVSGSQGDFALVSEWMFLKALKWHFDTKDMDNLIPEADSVHDLFSIQIRLLYVSETNLLVIKISQKDNNFGSFTRAQNAFCTKTGLLQIWDFSGQTNQLSVSDRKSNDEVTLELHIYNLLYTMNAKEKETEETIGENSMINLSVDNVYFQSRLKPSFSLSSGVSGACTLGLTGLENLGNTCFMNSAIQCLVHTPKLVNYFLGDFRKDLNFENPLGMNGKLAVAFGDLLRKLWSPGVAPVSPRVLRSTISSFAPQFGGYNQHDSQEFLSFLLDGLHEDLNRVKSKPYVQAKDENGRPVEEVADEYWANHLSRNDSVIVDLCQGQYQSTLVCPVCKKLSITFDPFMYLSLPLPATTLRSMTLTVLNTNGTNLPFDVTLKLPINGTFRDLVDSLVKACSLRDDETLVIAEVYNDCIFRILEDPNDSIELIRDYDKLVAYRLPKELDGSPLVEFVHQKDEKSYLQSFPSFNKFGIPLMSRISDFSKGFEIRKEFLKLINPLLMPVEDFFNNSDDSQKNSHEDEVDIDWADDETGNDLNAPSDFEFYVESGTTAYPRYTKIQMDEPVPVEESGRKIKVIVNWPERKIEEYDTCIMSLLPEVCKPTFKSNRHQDLISLNRCFDAFLKEEPLGPEDMWYCPNCKDHRQASKKLDLWRSPEILIIHLKRFSYNRIFGNKVETFVDFPIDDFDLSNYVIHKNSNVSHRYTLYAVSNHYGGMGAGHYTAYTKHGHNRWYEFDDSHVFPVSEEKIKTPSAYVLFYKRI